MSRKRIDKLPPQARKQVEADLLRLTKAIQKKREGMGLTQEQLAERLDISVTALQSIEQGRRFPSLSMLFVILHELGLEFRLR